MKNNRQEQILDIVTSESVETQEQLIERLRERGVECTQATVSRDIKQLRLVKEPVGGGHYRYALSTEREKLGYAERLHTILRESFVSVDSARNIVVLKTMPGLAGAAGSMFDGMSDPRIVGSLAGDDTVMIVMRDENGAQNLRKEIEAMRK
ncbi:MAG: arginine repressor [Ruminococcaceae bacterium]|nr:arginine repressor [Oscillospiraceae bacterium]